MRLDHKNLRRPRHRLSCELWICEGCILSGEVGFDHPTDGCTRLLPVNVHESPTTIPGENDAPKGNMISSNELHQLQKRRQRDRVRCIVTRTTGQQTFVRLLRRFHLSWFGRAWAVRKWNVRRRLNRLLLLP